MKKRSTLPLLSAAVFAAVVAAPLVAHAQRRSPLEDAPAVRKRVELRSTRFEAGAGLGTSINQTFYHAILVNVHLGFHLSDWLSISAFAAFNVASPGTGFQTQLQTTLPDAPDPDRRRDPTKSQERSALNKMSMMLGGQAELTPFTGKYSLFGKLFAHYDFYAFLGPGFINVTPTGSNLNPCDNNNTRECAVSGLKPGGNVGLGLHTFFNQWLALNVELRDIIAQINPAGRDVNGDGHADANDEHWSHTFMVGANLVIYLPATADISP